MTNSRRTVPFASLAVGLLLAGGAPRLGAQGATPVVAASVAAAAPAPKIHGRIEDLGNGLRLLRVWGTPHERGYAHGHLLGEQVAAIATAEFQARFARKQPLLQQARAAVGRLIEYPDDVQQELAGLFAGLQQRGVDLDMPELGRRFDFTDLCIANALDVFGLMGCSGFTAWGEQVDGGGVLTGRNFDWPLSGAHLVDGTILLVEHLPDGHAVASVTWPGYVATVTGVSSAGVTAFLHTGSGRISYTPEPSSWPTAVAARAILERVRPSLGKEAFPLALELLSNTSPPAGYLTRVILPAAPAGDVPVGLFETDTRRCVRAKLDGPSIVTNHFQGRDDGREAAKDSLDRHATLRGCLGDCLQHGDQKLDVAEAWTLLQRVERGGKRAFGTLHALVFRHEPWCFELRIGQQTDAGLAAAPGGGRRFALTREQLFPAGPFER